MTGVFRANNPLNTALLFVYGLLLKLPYLLNHPVLDKSPSDSFVFRKLTDTFDPTLSQWPVIATVIVYLLLFIQATALNYYLNSRRMTSKPNYLPGMAFLLISSFFPEWNTLTPALIVNTFLIWIIGKLLLLDNIPNARPLLFNLGFVIGICSLLYLPSMLLLLVVILSLTIARPPKIAEWVMVFLGFITIWYFLYSWLFLTDQLAHFKLSGLDFDLPDIQWRWQTYAIAGMLALTFLIGFLYQQGESLKQAIQTRRQWSIILAGVVITLFIPFFAETDDFRGWILSLSFLSFFIGIGFYHIRSRRLSLLIHWLMVAMVIYVEYFP